MTIDEAIRRLDAEVMIAQNRGNFTGADAIKLGSEALKHIVFIRENYPAYLATTLPGETDEKTEASHET